MTQERRRTRRGVDTAPRTAAVWRTVAALTVQRQAELGRPLRVLDLGGGTGGLAVPLAEAGHDVIVIDPSPDALASLRRRAAEVGVEETITALQGDADTVRSVLPGGKVDLVCLHGTLEVVDDPQQTLRHVAEVVTDGGFLSLVTAQRLAAVLARALAGHFHQARHALTSPDGRWGEHDPLPRRFDQEQVSHYVASAGFSIEQCHGVRLLADLVPSEYLDSDSDRAALLELETAMTAHPDHVVLGHLGSAFHVVARRH